MLTQSLNTSTTGNKVAPAAYAAPDQFCDLTGHVGLVATEFSYRKDEEIYGEDEPAEYVYQVIRGAVRTYKLLSDGRRQIGTFLLPGNVFGLESGTSRTGQSSPIPQKCLTWWNMRSALSCPSSPSDGKKPGLGSTNTEAASAALPPNDSISQAKLSACHSAVSGSTIGLRVNGHMLISHATQRRAPIQAGLRVLLAT